MTMMPSTQIQTVIPIPEIADARRSLEEAIEQSLPLAIVSRRYVAYIVARTGTKYHAAHAIGINRRTIQRWMKHPEPCLEITKARKEAGLVS